MQEGLLVKSNNSTGTINSNRNFHKKINDYVYMFPITYEGKRISRETERRLDVFANQIHQKKTMNAKEYQKKMIDEILSKFRQAGALSKDTAKTLEEIGLLPEQNPDHKIGLFYLKSQGYVIRKKDTYYLSEEALAKPFLTFVKRSVKLFLIIFPIMVLLLIIIVILNEYHII